MKAADAFLRMYRFEVPIYINKERVCSALADVQHISGSLERADFGFFKERRLKMFCAPNEFIRPGAEAEFKGERYIIEDAYEDSLGVCAVMRLLGGYDED